MRQQFAALSVSFSHQDAGFYHLLAWIAVGMGVLGILLALRYVLRPRGQRAARHMQRDPFRDSWFHEQVEAITDAIADLGDDDSAVVRVFVPERPTLYGRVIPPGAMAPQPSGVALMERNLDDVLAHADDVMAEIRASNTAFLERIDAETAAVR
jgi:hypothetical protein